MGSPESEAHKHKPNKMNDAFYDFSVETHCVKV